jgi:hypothetical protein
VIGLFRLRRRHAAPPGDTTRAAMPMLPPDIQAAINAVLRDQDDPAHVLDTRKLDPPSRAPAAVASASPPPYLFVVRAGEVLTFNSLRTLTRARPDLLGVVFDRRWRDERRRRQEAAPSERRRVERRRATPAPSWIERGFVLVSPARPSPGPGTDLPPRSGEVRAPATPPRAASAPWVPAAVVGPARPPADVAAPVAAASAPVPTVAAAPPPAGPPAGVAAPVAAASAPVPTVVAALPLARPPADAAAPVAAAASAPVPTVVAAPIPARQPAASVAPRASASRPVPKRPPASSADGARRRGLGAWTVAGRVGIVLALGGGALAALYLLDPGRSVEVIQRALRVELGSAPPPAPTAAVERPPPPPPAPLAAKPEVDPPSAAPPSSSPARRDQRSTGAPPARPTEPPSGPRVAGKPCIAPIGPTVAVQDGVVLGALIGAKPDAASRPPRCLFVVRRADGSLWAVDASRVEARSTSSFPASRPASEK